MSDYNKKKELYWMCRRGTKELDELTLRYLNEYYDQASSEHRKAFEDMLQLADPDLYNIIVGTQPSSSRLIDEIAKCIRRESLD